MTTCAASSGLSPTSAPTTPKQVFAALEAKARDDIKSEGLDATKARYWRELDLRYAGQGYELRTPLDGLFAARVTADTLARARTRFDERHAQIHGHSAGDRPVEVVSYRLRLRVEVPKFEQREEQSSAPRPAADCPQRRARRLLRGRAGDGGDAL